MKSLRTLASLALAVLCLSAACATSSESTGRTMIDGQIVTATYRVPVGNQDAFVAVLKRAETTMREAELITPWPVTRMRSKKDPEFILEIFQWTYTESFGQAQASRNSKGALPHIRTRPTSAGGRSVSRHRLRVGCIEVDSSSYLRRNPLS
jgi:hypothetical protein